MPFKINIGKKYGWKRWIIFSILLGLLYIASVGPVSVLVRVAPGQQFGIMVERVFFAAYEPLEYAARACGCSGWLNRYLVLWGWSPGIHPLAR